MLEYELCETVNYIIHTLNVLLEYFASFGTVLRSMALFLRSTVPGTYYMGQFLIFFPTV